MKERKQYEQSSDRITMLVLFKALNELGFDTRWLKLEKLVYLANVFGSIHNRNITNQEFFVWNLGPFSKQVYSDLESCVTHQLLNAIPKDEKDELNERSFEYTITEKGLSTANQAIEEAEFRSKYDLILHILQVIGPLSTNEIRQLSYGEPQFRKAKEKGKGAIIDPHFPESTRIASLARKVAKNDYGLSLSDDEVAFLYFKLIEALATPK